MFDRVTVIDNTAVSGLRRICLDIAEYVPLRDLTRWRTGGAVRCLATPSSLDELISVIRFCRENDVASLVVGSTSNLLFSDEFMDFVLVKVGNKLNKIAIENNRVVSEAGVWVPCFVQKVARSALDGAQHMAGIPGTLGGLIYMNGGSQRKGVSDNLVSVESLNYKGEVLVRTAKECCFSYRYSVFQNNEEVILKATFEYEVSPNKKNTLNEIRNILKSRRLKFPLKMPNCGSVFVSNPSLYETYGPPGMIFERLKLKGLAQGRAMVSNVHANFIVNLGGATSCDILHLIFQMQRAAEKETGVRLHSEVRYVDHFGNTIPADEEARNRFAGIH